MNTIKVNEIFYSIQGESTWAGTPCAFVRLAGCNCRCLYCDTSYALHEGTDRSFEDIVNTVKKYSPAIVEVTGGEPLIHRETPKLCQELLKLCHPVLVETNGTLDISVLPSACIRIMDIKCPSSQVDVPFLRENIHHLNKNDECKMVISNREDFDWAVDFIKQTNLHTLCTTLFSPNHNWLTLKELAQWILSDQTPVRLGFQLHKTIWDPNTRGV